MLIFPGKVSDFARWRFYKNNIPVIFIIVNPTDRLKLSDEYDIIFSDAVIEHLTDPEQVVEELSLHLKEKWRVNHVCGFKVDQKTISGRGAVRLAHLTGGKTPNQKSRSYL